MSESQKPDTKKQEEHHKKEMPAWCNSLVKLVQNLLEFNMLTYKKEKADRL